MQITSENKISKKLIKRRINYEKICSKQQEKNKTGENTFNSSQFKMLITTIQNLDLIITTK